MYAYKGEKRKIYVGIRCCVLLYDNKYRNVFKIYRYDGTI